MNKKLYGDDFYRRIGSKGGRNGHTGGFAANPALARVAGAKGGQNGHTGGFASNPALARVAGRKGGRISTRKGIRNGEGKWRLHRNTYKIVEDGKVITKINVKYIPTN